MTRRQAGYVGAMTALSYSKVVGANDKLQMGYIGLGNRGDQVHDGFLEYGDQETVAVLQQPGGQSVSELQISSALQVGLRAGALTNNGSVFC